MFLIKLKHICLGKIRLAKQFERQHHAAEIKQIRKSIQNVRKRRKTRAKQNKTIPDSIVISVKTLFQPPIKPIHSRCVIVRKGKMPRPPINWDAIRKRR